MIHSLNFYNHLALNKKVQSVPCVKLNFSINNGEGFLLFHGDAALSQFEGEASFVSGLQKTWTEGPVHLDSSTDDFAP